MGLRPPFAIYRAPSCAQNHLLNSPDDPAHLEKGSIFFRPTASGLNVDNKYTNFCGSPGRAEHFKWTVSRAQPSDGAYGQTSYHVHDPVGVGVVVGVVVNLGWWSRSLASTLGSDAAE